MGKRFSFLTKKGLGAKRDLTKTMARLRERVRAKRVTVVIDGVTVGEYRKPRLWTKVRARLSHMAVGATLRLRTKKGVRAAVRRVSTTDDRRLRAVKEAYWMISRAGSIHYSQRRPYPLYKEGALPRTLDCSGSVCLLAYHADLGMPAGVAWGYGDTDGILRTCSAISKGAALPGDYVLWHYGSDGRHVAMVLKAGSDPLLFSHGYEGGPLLIRFSAEDRYHASATATFLRART